jgi:hypothetical protein
LSPEEMKRQVNEILNRNKDLLEEDEGNKVVEIKEEESSDSETMEIEK